MISSNAGSWSSTESGYNNVVKAFKFKTGDVITCEYDPYNKLVTFKCANDTYELTNVTGGDCYNPCVLFHYAND